MVWTRKGQAEIIGGIIVVTALIIALGMVLTNIIGTSSMSISGISRRSQFEVERSLEKLIAVYRDNVCYIRNAGQLPIRIIRVWVEAEPIDLGEGIVVGAGEEVSAISIQMYRVINIWEADLLVTSRGNVFQPKAMCENVKPMYYYYITKQEFIGYFTSDQILNPVRLTNGMTKGYVYAEVSSDSQTPTARAVIYNRSGTWYCSSKTDYGTIDTRRVDIRNSDMDQNSVHEVIITTSGSCTQQSFSEWESGRGSKSVRVVFYFNQLLYIDRETIDTITIHFKIVTSISGGTSQQLSVLPYVRIYSEGLEISTPASIATAGARGDLVVISGSAIFPVKAFGFQLSSGIYNLALSLELTGTSIKVYGVRLEYIAVVGALFANPWQTST